MRITSNMLVQQIVQAAKGEGVLKSAAGAAITARIAEVLGNILTLDTGNGNLITAKDVSGKTFQQGQTVVFEVLGQDEAGNVQIRPVTTGEEPDLQQDSLGALLKKMNLPDTTSNRELFRVLTAYRIPLNMENVKAAQEISIQAKGVVQIAEAQGGGILVGRESEPLKQLAVRLVEMAVTVAKGSTSEIKLPDTMVHGVQNSEGEALEALAKMRISNAPLQSFDDGLSGEGQRPVPEKTVAGMPQEVKNGSVAGKAPYTSMVGSGQDTPQAVVVAEDGEAARAAAPPILESQKGEALKEILKELTFEKIGFVLKNQLPGDLETLSSLEKLILGKKDIGTQLRDLLVILPTDEVTAPLKEAIQNAVKAVHITPDMNPFELQKQLKSLNHALSAIAAQAAETMSNHPKIQDALTDVKNSLDFLGRLSESSTYLHVPVNLGQGTKPMDLYVQRDKSGQKRVNPKDTRIFISLDTNHLNTVQCLVEVKDKTLNIGFKLADKDSLATISSYFEPLKEALAELGFRDALIHGVVYQRPLNLIDISQEPSLDLRQIDMRI